MRLSADQLERYACHILLKEIGGAGQQKLLKAKVLVIGAGGLGCPLLAYLAAAGIGTIGVIDDDRISLSNLQRQTLYTAEDVGALKVDIAKRQLEAQNPDCTIIALPERLTATNAAEIIGTFDLVADGCDNFATRFLVNDACYFAQKTLVSAAVGRFDGQLATFKPFENAEDGKPFACYRSLVPEMPKMRETDDMFNCNETGVVGALTGIMGSLQALEVIKEITGAGESLAGRLMIYDGLAARSRVIKLPWDAQNPLNGTKPIFTDLSHHQ